MLDTVQQGILDDVPRAARYLFLDLKHGSNPADFLKKLPSIIDRYDVIGFGATLLKTVNTEIDGLRNFPSYAVNGVQVPSTPCDLWIWLRSDDRGDLIHKTRYISHMLKNDFEMRQVIDAFQYRDSRDLTGYEDGTENPKDDEAIAAGIVQGRGEGFDGSSFVAVQQWNHDLDTFKSLPQSEQDDIIGRRLADNEEFDEAPESAHVKRSAQESFEPEAFMLRRSMPWANEEEAGLIFVAFGKTLDAYEAVLQRMTGSDDGIVDAMFRFTRPVTGSFYWCPPMKNGQLDLSLLNLKSVKKAAPV